MKYKYRIAQMKDGNFLVQFKEKGFFSSIFGSWNYEAKRESLEDARKYVAERTIDKIIEYK